MLKIKAYAKMKYRKVIINQTNSMQQYFIERDTLEKFVNPMIAEKYPDGTPENIDTIRDTAVEQLDDKILEALFGKLTKSQVAEVNIMFDQEEDNPDAFRDFFKKVGIDVEAEITEAVKQFGLEFIGGQNA